MHRICIVQLFFVCLFVCFLFCFVFVFFFLVLGVFTSHNYCLVQHTENFLDRSLRSLLRRNKLYFWSTRLYMPKLLWCGNLISLMTSVHKAVKQVSARRNICYLLLLHTNGKITCHLQLMKSLLTTLLIEGSLESVLLHMPWHYQRNTVAFPAADSQGNFQ